MIEDILKEIDKLTYTYNEGEDINIDSLIDLFIINQLTNKKSN